MKSVRVLALWAGTGDDGGVHLAARCGLAGGADMFCSAVRFIFSCAPRRGCV